MLVEQTRADLKPALTNLESVVDVLNKNQDNLDESLRLMAPFYRVFANTLGTGPWFDTWIRTCLRSRRSGGEHGHREASSSLPGSSCVALRRRGRAAASFCRRRPAKTLIAEFPRTVSLYEGSDVKILGVAVGKVDTVDAVGHQGRW